MPYRLLIFLALNLLLLGLAIPARGELGPAWLALELAWLTLALAVLAPFWRRLAALTLAMLLALLVLLASADGLARLSFGRPFNPLLDLDLASAAFHQLTQNLGAVFAVLLIATIMAGLALFIYLAFRGLNQLTGRSPPSRLRWLMSLLLLVPLIPGASDISSLSYRMSTPALNLITFHWQQMHETRQAYADFKRQLAQQEQALGPRALPALAGRDVIVAFIESYGISAVHDPRYSQRIQPRLADMAQRLSEAGIQVATHRLTSPVQGGQSWLAHATLLSGLWLTTQRHYELLLEQRQATLIDDFRRSGHRTLAIMPAITQPWPEGQRLGYEHILSAREIPYNGPALNWVTMPDQFTWRFFESVRQQHSAPLFAELALISSHAPWTPILSIIDDWEALGDGTLFARWEQSGESPEQLWRDPDKVRDHYAQAVDYALAAVAGYAERYLNDDALVLVVGDHQPAPLITGADASRDVPIHVLSRDSSLVAAFIEAGFTPGVLPSPESSSALRMDDLRPLLHRLFGE